MSALLSIAIPTFNRPERIKYLYANFLSKLYPCFGDLVEVIVCDNSDIDKANTNRETLAGSNIGYNKNTTNIGFSGNVVRCLREAEGKFIWIISDDDEVAFDPFCRLITWLEHPELSVYNAIMLPFYNSADNGERCLMNSNESWGGKSEDLSVMIKRTEKIPFILFSSVVLRNPRHSKDVILHKISTDFVNNDFIQIPLFISFVSKDGKVAFYNEALQDYKSPDYVRFSLIGMVESMEQVIKFLNDFYNLSGCRFYKSHYQRWMQWLIWNNAGIVKVKDGDVAKWVLVKKWHSLHFRNIKNFKLLCLALLPKFLLKIVYLNSLRS